MSKITTVGIIGAGFVAGFHARALRSVRGVELKGIHALKGAEQLATKARADGLGDTHVYESVIEMCKSVDVVCIFSPNFTRVDMAGAIAEAVRQGAELKGVICEKPLARTIKEAKDMVEMITVCGLRTAYYENQIHMPAVKNCRTQLAAVSAKMGPVSLTRSAEEHGGPHEPWFWDPTQQGGGVWCDMGCHSAAVGMYMLTPNGKAPDFLVPRYINATMALLKWKHEPWLSKLMARGVDYTKKPAEDYALVTIEFENPETGQYVIAQATDSWMYDAPGLRLLMEAIGPGYSYSVNTLQSPAGLFISDAAAEAVQNAELALEKSQAARGSLVVQANEPDLYGYVEEWQDAIAAFNTGKDGLLNFKYGLLIAKLVAAGYLSHENGCVVDFNKIDETYVPLIHQGKGLEVL